MANILINNVRYNRIETIIPFLWRSQRDVYQVNCTGARFQAVSWRHPRGWRRRKTFTNPLRGKLTRQFAGGRIKVFSVFSRTPSTRDHREFSQETHPREMSVKNSSTSDVLFESIWNYSIRDDVNCSAGLMKFYNVWDYSFNLFIIICTRSRRNFNHFQAYRLILIGY